jgi:hypothetical protein
MLTRTSPVCRLAIGMMIVAVPAYRPGLIGLHVRRTQQNSARTLTSGAAFLSARRPAHALAGAVAVELDQALFLVAV